MQKNQKKGVVAYVIEDLPSYNKLRLARASANPTLAIEGALAELDEPSAEKARKKLGPVIEGRASTDQMGAYLQEHDLRLKGGGKAILAVLPCEVDA